MGKAARLKRQRREARMTVAELFELEDELLARLRYDQDSTLTLVVCDGCGTAQSNLHTPGLPYPEFACGCLLCPADTGTYL